MATTPTAGAGRPPPRNDSEGLRDARSGGLPHANGTLTPDATEEGQHWLHLAWPDGVTTGRKLEKYLADRDITVAGFLDSLMYRVWSEHLPWLRVWAADQQADHQQSQQAQPAQDQPPPQRQR